ncbi:MAG: hypothetical protein ACK56F_26955, partial [bacterium]
VGPARTSLPAPPARSTRPASSWERSAACSRAIRSEERPPAGQLAGPVHGSFGHDGVCRGEGRE